MQSFDLDSLMEQDQMINQMREKQQKYHEIFQQLSTTRSQLRKNKQQLDLLKISHKGSQEQIDTLRDIIKQKKDIIIEMRQELEEKTLQLNMLENQNNQILKQKQQLEGKLQQQQSENMMLKQRINQHQNKQRYILDSKQEIQHNFQICEQKKKQLQIQFKALETESHKINMELQNFSYFKQNKCQSKSITEQIKHLVQIVDKNKQSMRQSENTTFSLHYEIDQYKKRIQSSNSLLEQKQKQLNLIRLQNTQYQQEIKQQSQNYSQSLVDKQNQIQQLIEINTTQRRQNKQHCRKIEELQSLIIELEKSKAQNILPIIHSVLGQQLSSLLLKYIKSQNQQQIIIGNEIDNQCSLIIYNKARQSNVDITNQQLKNRVIQYQEENQILKIKICNLEKAYEHAIDDYRRSLKFKAICQSNKTIYKHNKSQSYKQNQSPNY